MITKQLFKTYKRDSFPLFVKSPDGEEQACFDGGKKALPYLFTDLILDLSDMCDIPQYCYMARHNPDTIPEKHLLPFREKYSALVDTFAEWSIYWIPTIWFVVYARTDGELRQIEGRLTEKNVGFSKDQNPNRYESISKLGLEDNKGYVVNDYESSAFPKFLHQTTQIGVDLLKNPKSIEKLGELRDLEGMRYNSIEKKTADLRELQGHLIRNSKYYRKDIEQTDELSPFWDNFQRVYGMHSWPHFLFNICGV